MLKVIVCVEAHLFIMLHNDLNKKKKTAPSSSKDPGGTISVTTQISMACIFVAITPLLLMEWAGSSLLPQENRDENNTSGFLNCHAYSTKMKQYQLNKKIFEYLIL